MRIPPSPVKRQTRWLLLEIHWDDSLTSSQNHSSSLRKTLLNTIFNFGTLIRAVWKQPFPSMAAPNLGQRVKFKQWLEIFNGSAAYDHQAGASCSLDCRQDFAHTWIRDRFVPNVHEGRQRPVIVEHKDPGSGQSDFLYHADEYAFQRIHFLLRPGEDLKVIMQP